jgi:hypothetical protein
MAYEIHIERVNDKGEPADESITLSEWKAAIENQKNVRLASNDIVGTNPATGEVIRIPNSDGDAEVFFPEESKWYRVYRWRKGKINFKGLPSFDNPNDTIRQTTRLLAEVLGARIVGDEGEFYD